MREQWLSKAVPQFRFYNVKGGTRFLKHLAEKLYQPGISENAFPLKLRQPGVSDIFLKLPAAAVRQSGASENAFSETLG